MADMRAAEWSDVSGFKSRKVHDMMVTDCSCRQELHGRSSRASETRQPADVSRICSSEISQAELQNNCLFRMGLLECSTRNISSSSSTI